MCTFAHGIGMKIFLLLFQSPRNGEDLSDGEPGSPEELQESLPHDRSSPRSAGSQQHHNKDKNNAENNNPQQQPQRGPSPNMLPHQLQPSNGLLQSAGAGNGPGGGGVRLKVTMHQFFSHQMFSIHNQYSLSLFHNIPL